MRFDLGRVLDLFFVFLLLRLFAEPNKDDDGADDEARRDHGDVRVQILSAIRHVVGQAEKQQHRNDIEN